MEREHEQDECGGDRDSRFPHEPQGPAPIIGIALALVISAALILALAALINGGRWLAGIAS